MDMTTMIRRMVLATTLSVLAGLACAQNGFDLHWTAAGGVGECITGGSFLIAGDTVSTSGPGETGGSFDLQPGFMQDASYFPVPVTVSGFSVE